MLKMFHHYSRRKGDVLYFTLSYDPSHRVCVSGYVPHGYESRMRSFFEGSPERRLKTYLIKLEFKNAVNGYVVAPESKYGYNTAISQNGCHWGYCDQFHIVRCNVFPLGLPENEWIHAFTDAWGSGPIVTRIPLP